MNFNENENAIMIVKIFLDSADSLTERCGGARYLPKTLWDLICKADSVWHELIARREEWEQTGERPDDDLAEW